MHGLQKESRSFLLRVNKNQVKNKLRSIYFNQPKTANIETLHKNDQRINYCILLSLSQV